MRRVNTLIVGAGQAGLACSYCLKQHGVDHLVLEASDCVGHVWRDERWDSFCLVTPNWQCQLPGHYYDGNDPDGFWDKAAVIEYLQGYQRRFSLPVQCNVRVSQVTRQGALFHVQTDVDEWICEHLVVATGNYHQPRIPDFAAELSPDIRQLHSSYYKHVQQLCPGGVLVVGSGQSGCQIAEELHEAGRRVWLSVGASPKANRRYRGKDVVRWLDTMGYYDLTRDEHPDAPYAERSKNHFLSGRDGGHDIDLFGMARDGMRLCGRLLRARGDVVYFKDDLSQNLVNAEKSAANIRRMIDDYIKAHGLPVDEEPLELKDCSFSSPGHIDLKQQGITSVVWCTGFQFNYQWLSLPNIKLDQYPRHNRGVSDQQGLYYVGLNWQYRWGSGRFYQVGDDAEYIASCIARSLP